MNIESLRNYCIAKNGVEECLPFGPDTLVFKVGSKLFLLASMDAMPLQFNIKCEPEHAILLREQYSCVQPGYHMNKKHWNTIIADGTVGEKLLQQWIDDSYKLVVNSLSKNLKQQIDLEKQSGK
jgi:predicted DNA-binding protein (MmcQ/YjbR family)